MPAIHFTESERAWLERFAAAYGVTWLHRKAKLERPSATRPGPGLPLTTWSPPPPTTPPSPDA